MMKKKALAIIFTLFLGLGIFTGQICLAKLNSPTPILPIPPENIGEGSVKVSWQWTSGGGTINRFIISYRIEKISSLTLEGTIAVTHLSTAVSGEETLFTTQLVAGDYIKIETEIFKVSAIIDDSNLNLDSAYQGETASELTAYRLYNPNPWTKRYPSAGVRGYTIRGLTEQTTYEWTIMAEAENPTDNSEESDIDAFTTKAGTVNSNGSGLGNGGSPIGLINPLAADTLEEALNAFINFLFWLAMAVAPILIVYAGFLLLTAAGDPAKISKARQVITWTLVAVAIILFAKGLPALIKGAFGG